MGLYDDQVLPHLIDRACSMGQIMKLRSQVVPEYSGTVLEIGMGAGINLAFYNPAKVQLVYGLEPSDGMRRKARTNLAKSPVKVEWLDLPGEKIPLERPAKHPVADCPAAGVSVQGAANGHRLRTIMGTGTIIGTGTITRTHFRR